MAILDTYDLEVIERPSTYLNFDKGKSLYYSPKLGTLEIGTEWLDSIAELTEYLQELYKWHQFIRDNYSQGMSDEYIGTQICNIILEKLGREDLFDHMRAACIVTDRELYIVASERNRGCILDMLNDNYILINYNFNEHIRL